MIPLELCPFCGSHAKVQSWADITFVQCQNQYCAARVEVHGKDNVQGVMAKWNRRDTPVNEEVFQ